MGAIVCMQTIPSLAPPAASAIAVTAAADADVTAADVTVTAAVTAAVAVMSHTSSLIPVACN